MVARSTIYIIYRCSRRHRTAIIMSVEQFEPLLVGKERRDGFGYSLVRYSSSSRSVDRVGSSAFLGGCSEKTRWKSFFERTGKNVGRAWASTAAPHHLFAHHGWKLCANVCRSRCCPFIDQTATLVFLLHRGTKRRPTTEGKGAGEDTKLTWGCWEQPPLSPLYWRRGLVVPPPPNHLSFWPESTFFLCYTRGIVVFEKNIPPFWWYPRGTQRKSRVPPGWTVFLLCRARPN